MTRACFALTALGSLGLALSASAQEITPVSFVLNGETLTFEQSSSIDAEAVASLFARGPECASICITPMSAAEGVETIGEADVMTFVTDVVAQGAGLLIDGRSPETHGIGMIAGSVHLPAALIGDDNPFRDQILVALGAREFEGIYNFSDALPLVIYDAGPASTDASDLVTALVDLGYPTGQIQYYRGGLQVWTSLGLNLEDI